MSNSTEFIASETQIGIPAPEAKKVPHTTEIHGLKLEDPYFWMRLSDKQKESSTQLQCGNRVVRTHGLNKQLIN